MRKGKKQSKKSSCSQKNNLHGASLIIILVILTIIVHIKALNNEFVWDDIFLIKESKASRSFSLVLKAFVTDFWKLSSKRSNSGYYRPIVNLSYFLDNLIFKGKAWGFHLTNILLNAINTILLFIFINKIANSKYFAFIGTLFFALHPVHVEPVAWISGRTDLLAFMFSMLFCICLSKNNKLFHFLGGIFLFLALLSKEVAICIVFFPILLSSSETLKSKLRKLTFSIIFIILYFSLRVYALSGIGGAPTTFYKAKGAEAFLTLFHIFYRYVVLTLFPLKLCPDYGYLTKSEIYSFSTALGFVFLAGIIYLIIYLFKCHFASSTQQLILLGLLCYIISLLPVSNIIPIDAPMAERYLYFSTAGYAIFLTGVFLYLKLDKKKKLLVPVFLILIYYFYLNFNYNIIWQNEETLFKYTTTVSKTSARAFFNMGVALSQKRLYQKALYYLNKALEIKPDYVDALNTLGVCYIKLGKPEKGVKYLKKALKIVKNHSDSLYNLGLFYFQTGNYLKAEINFKKALQANPYHLDAKAKLAECLSILRKYKEAIFQIETLLSLDSTPDILNSAGLVYKRAGFLKKALTFFKKAIREAPHLVEAYNNASNILRAMGKLKEAKSMLKKALKISPDFPIALFNLATLTSDMHMRKQLLIRAIKSNKNFLHAYPYLYKIYIKENDYEKAFSIARTIVKFKHPYFINKLLQITPSNLKRELKQLIKNSGIKL